MLGFRDTWGRLKAMMDVWQESGKAALYKPKVISRHEYGYKAWLSDCLNAARTRLAPLGAEELDRVTVVAFWRGYVDSTGKELHGNDRQPNDQVLVDISVAQHHDAMQALHDAGTFEMYNSDGGNKLLNDANQRRQPGALILIAFNEIEKPAPVAAVVSFMKNDPDLDMGEISDVAALKKKH